MTPRKFKILIATASYGGNGGFSSQHPEVGRYIAKVERECIADPRVEGVAYTDIADTPITMGRNRMAVMAIEGGADFLLMVDSDMHCDYGVERGMKPFFATSFDYAVKHWDKGPVMVGAPYCGPPPYENVYIFQWDSGASGIANQADMRLVRYERTQARYMAGIQDVAALATGLLLIDVRLFTMTDPKLLFQKLLAEGHTVQEAESRIKPWFYYEWKNVRQDEKVSTEDVTFSRDMSLWGVNVLGYNPVKCNWDAWAGHYKPHLVTKPILISADDVGFRMSEAIRLGRSSNEQLIHLDFSEPPDIRSATGVPVPVQQPDPPADDGSVPVLHGGDSGGGGNRADNPQPADPAPGTGGTDSGPAGPRGSLLEQLVEDARAWSRRRELERERGFSTDKPEDSA